MQDDLLEPLLHNVKHDRLSDPAAPYRSHCYDLYDVAFRTS